MFIPPESTLFQREQLEGKIRVLEMRVRIMKMRRKELEDEMQKRVQGHRKSL